MREGRLRGLSATGRTRPRQMPEVPTLAEVGYPGFVEDVWFGLWGAAGLPRARQTNDTTASAPLPSSQISSGGGRLGSVGWTIG